MWWAGIGWVDADLEVAVVDDAGHEVLPPTRVRGVDETRLVTLLRDVSATAPAVDGAAGLAAVVESTNGMVDGHLHTHGIPVHRLDPPVLPARTRFGSVPADVLARTASQLARTPEGSSSLPRLALRTGTIAGRDADSRTHAARSLPVERTLASAGRFVVHGDRRPPQVALTFDDGPHPDFTPRVLDVLASYGAHASFFCVGLNAKAHPALVERVAAEGHLVGNHTWSHPYLPDLSRDEVLRQLDATNDALTAATGLTPTHARPPYGVRTPEALQAVADLGMTTVVWDVDVGDWRAPGVEAVRAGATQDVRNGSIVLLHDAGGDRSGTVAALPHVLETLLERGYRLVTVDQLTAAPTQ